MKRAEARSLVTLVCVAGVAMGVACGVKAENGPSGNQLEQLTTAGERAFLMRQLEALEPPTDIQRLAGLQKWQDELGGGFYGLMPAQLTNARAIPIPESEQGSMAAALLLARQREANLKRIREMNGNFPTAFTGARIPPLSGRGPAGMKLEIDDVVIAEFLKALDSGRVSAEEANAIARLPANQEMLKHRAALGYVPAPLPTTDSLSKMIMHAGSQDPVDRLWCWINPHNYFDYADVVQHAKEFKRLLSEIDSHKTALEGAVLSRISAYAPAGQTFNGRICLTVEPWIRGWATAYTAGMNLEFFKDDWESLLGTMSHETYHRLQLRMCGTASGKKPETFEDLASADLGDERYDRLYEAVSYTALEGTASVVGRTGSKATPAEGADLLGTFVKKVIQGRDPKAADAIINEGLKSNGPLYALGIYCTHLVEQKFSRREVGRLLSQNPCLLIVRAAEEDAKKAEPLLDAETREALMALWKRIEAQSMVLPN